VILEQVFASDQIGFPVLSLLLVLPLIASAALLMIKDDTFATKIAIWASAAELALAGFVWANFIPGSSDLQFVEQIGPMPGLGISYHLGVDGISMLFIPATAVLSLLAMIYADTSVKENIRGYLAALLAFEAAMMGAFMAVDLMLFWLFFAIEIVPSYFLITRWGTGGQRRAAANSYLIHMALASAAVLVAIVLMATKHASAVNSEVSFSYIDLLSATPPDQTQTVIFFILCLGFAIKAPLFPFHTWMPRVLEQGPVVGIGVFLVGIKLGTYGFLRFVIPLLPDASQEYYWLLATLGVISMVYGALIALVQTNLRRVLAFASLSHMGVVMLGLFSLNFQGLQGGLLQMLNLGITGAGLFFIAGFLFTRMGAPEVTRMGGLQAAAPVMGLSFLIIGLAGVGMPGTSGFNGEHLVMLGAFKQHWLMAVAVGMGTLLTAAYFLWFYQRAFLGDAAQPDRQDRARFVDLGRNEKLIAATLVAVIFWIGLYTTPFLQTMNGSIAAIEARVAKGDVPAAATLETISAPLTLAQEGTTP